MNFDGERLRVLEWIFENSELGVAVFTLQGKFLIVNPRVCEILGYTAQEFESLDMLTVTHPDSREESGRKLQELMSGKIDRIHIEKKYVRKDGETVHGLTCASLFKGKDGTPQFIVAQMSDVSERKMAVDALKISEDSYRSYVMNAPYGVFVADTEGKYLEVNPAACAITGYTEDELLEMSIIDILFEEDMARGFDHFKRVVAEGRASGELPFRHKSAERRWWSVSAVRLSPTRLMGFCEDVTERKRARAESANREIFLERIIEQSPFATWISDEKGVLLRANAALKRMLNVTDEQVVGKYNVLEDPLVERQGLTPLIRSVFDEGKTVSFRARWSGDEFPGKDFDGSNAVLIDATMFPIFDSQERLTNVVLNWIDISEQQRNLEDKKRLEEQLYQAQKLESVGRLAGGVAHDFNNLITTITGNIAIAQEGLEKDDLVYGILADIDGAAQRAADLTRQLLAFSRKQIIKPRTIDLNELIENMRRMIARIIGEDIELKTIPGEGVGAVVADPGQLEQVILNLAVNARDAMPKGGVITLETSNEELDEQSSTSHAEVKPGSYVKLAISDSGEGMDEEVLSHIFEPFFTTKKEDQGTGLGLATVYGIVKQHEGYVLVDSTQGKGTVFELLFPMAPRKAERMPKAAAGTEIAGGDESIMVVEDEPMVNDVAVRILERAGYKVCSATNGKEALNLARNLGHPLDLLLTDVVMPGMNGRELAEEVSKIIPDIKVLFTSGYTEDVIAHHGVLEAGIQFIGKPYTPQKLARKVRQVLDEEELS